MPQVNQQDYVVVPVRTAAILTSSYVAGSVLGSKNGTLNSPSPSDILLENYNQLNLLVDFTVGSLTDGRIKIEYSTDNSAFYQETSQTVIGPTSTDQVMEHVYTATGKYIVSVPVKARYIKVSAKGTGTVTDSLMAIKAIVGTI